MPTIGEVYNPIVQAALNDDPNGHELLKQLGQMLFELHPEKGTLEQAHEHARSNLDYYCQYFNDGADKVKAFYGLGEGFRGPDGTKLEAK